MLGTLGTLMADRNEQMDSVKLFESLDMKSCRMENRKLEKRTGSLFWAEMEIYISAICLTISESRLLTVLYRSTGEFKTAFVRWFVQGVVKCFGQAIGCVSSILDKLV